MDQHANGRPVIGLLTVFISGLFLILASPEARADSEIDSDSIEAEIAYPADIGYVNAKEHGVYGDGKHDDTIALRQIFNNNAKYSSKNLPNTVRTVLLPKGIYKITNSVSIDSCNLRILGAGKGQTIIRLANGSKGFGHTDTPKIVLKTGDDPQINDLANSGFNNFIQHLTIDVGDGNPGAIGVQLDIANNGAMEHVVIQSGRNSGRYGISFKTNPGPLLVKDVSIYGFDWGVYADNMQSNPLTLVDLKVKNQHKGGILNVGKNLLLERFQSIGNPVALKGEAGDNAATFFILDSTFRGTMKSGPAIELPASGFIYARGVTVANHSSFAAVAGKTYFPSAGTIREWSTLGYRLDQSGDLASNWSGSGTGPYRTSNLPPKTAPEYSWVAAGEGVSTAKYGSSSGGELSDALQKAIDQSGAAVIYVPYGTYSLSKDVQIRGRVKRIDLGFSDFSGSKGRLVVAESSAPRPFVLIENASALRVVHSTTTTVVVRNMSNGPQVILSSAGSGDLFIENFGAHGYLGMLSDDDMTTAHIWIRQVDRANTDWVLRGGTLRILGHNIETRIGHTTLYGTNLELIGGALDHLGDSGKCFNSTHDCHYTIASDGYLFDLREKAKISIVTAGNFRETNGVEGNWPGVIMDWVSLSNVKIKSQQLFRFDPQQGGTRFVLPVYTSAGVD